MKKKKTLVYSPQTAYSEKAFFAIASATGCIATITTSCLDTDSIFLSLFMYKKKGGLSEKRVEGKTGEDSSTNGRLATIHDR